MMNLGEAGRAILLGGVFVLGGCGARPLSGDVRDTDVDGIASPPPDAGVIVTAPPNAADITGLHFTTNSAFPNNPPPTNIDVTLTDPIPTRAIYDATLALPAFPPGRYNCPLDLGFTHVITFMKGQAVVVTATLNEGGCRDAEISGAPPARWTESADDGYWKLVARNLGVEESALFSFAGQ